MHSSAAKTAIIAGFVAVFFGAPIGANAQESLSITITPPLFQLRMNAGDFWASNIKVVNTNPFTLTVYASVFDFKAVGEEGQGKFVPILDGPSDESHSLSSWIAITKEAIVVPAGQSAEVPFTIRAPDNAEAGGHYAAILVGTRPAPKKGEGSVVSVSSLISSLIFVRIGGDVIEKGAIRDFYSDKSFYDAADAKFTLRFENSGNVHLLPQGDIIIYNMWGRERGRIPVNQETNFGSVLPGTIRKFSFSWKSKDNFFEVGRYKAIATLTFGLDARQNVHQITYFWIIPIKPVAGITGSLILFIGMMFVAVRAYIRRVIAAHTAHLSPAGSAIPALTTWTEPIRKGIIDLRNASLAQKEPPVSNPSPKNLIAYAKTYRFALISMGVLITGIIGFTLYFNSVFTEHREFNVTIDRE